MSTNTSQNIAPRPEPTEQLRALTPPVDIFESAQELLLFADLPGVGKEDVTLHFEKDRLTLEAKTPTVRYHREFLVSSGVDVDKTEATVQQGVLRLKLPKAKALQARQIKVLAG